MNENRILDAAQPSADPWRDAVEQMLTTTEQTASDDPRESLDRLIDWHVAAALDPLVSSDARALVQRGRGEVAAQPIAEPTLVQAAWDALACMREYSSTADEDCGDPGCDECHAMRPTWAAIDALRRALAASDGAGEAR